MPSDRIRRLPLLGLACLALPAIAATPETAPSTAIAPAPESASAGPRRAQFVLEQRIALDDMLKQQPKLAARSPENVVRVSVKDGHLTLEPGPNLPDECVVPLTEGRGAITFRRSHAGDGETAFTAVELRYLRLHGDDATAPAATSIMLSTSPMNVQVALYEMTPEAMTDGQLIDTARDATEDGGDPPNSKLTFKRTSELDENDAGGHAEQEGGVDHVEATFATLIERHHDDVVIAMAEGFTSLRAMHVLTGLTEPQVRQVLGTDAPVSSQAQQSVATILDELRQRGPDAAEPIGKQLAKDNLAAAIALAGADRAGWSADLTLLVDSVLADALPLPQRQARRALATPTRLVDALYWPDVSVRRLAKSRLESLDAEKRLSTFDADGDPYPQAATIESFRATLLATKRPQ